MAKPPRPWTVTPHGPLRRLDDNLWTVESPIPGIPGGNFPRTMMIVRLADGSLLFHNAVPVDDSALAEIRSIGKPAILVAPSPFHCIDAHAFREKLGVRVVCPSGCAAAVGERVKVDGHFDSLPADPALQAISLDGVRTGEGVLLVRSGGARVNMLLCDMMLNIAHQRGFWGFVWKIAGFTGGPRCGPVWLKRAVGDRAALRAHIERLADTPDLFRLVPSHGPPVENDPAATLRRVAAAIKVS
jgi:hypothetical protein